MWHAAVGLKTVIGMVRLLRAEGHECPSAREAIDDQAAQGGRNRNRGSLASDGLALRAASRGGCCSPGGVKSPTGSQCRRLPLRASVPSPETLMKRRWLCLIFLCLAWPLSAVAATEFVVLEGNNGFLASEGVPGGVVRWLKQVQGLPFVELKCFAFSPAGDWVFHFGGNGFYTSNLSLPLCHKLKELQEQDKGIKCIAFGPAWSWAVFWGRNGCAAEGFPDAARQKIAEVARNNGILRSIALAANGGWVVSFDAAGVAYGGIPHDLVRRLDETARLGFSVRSVAFVDGDWMCLTNHGWWTSNVEHPAAQALARLVKQGGNLKWLAAAPPCLSRAFDPHARYVLDTYPARKVKAVLTTDIAHPDATVEQWYLYAPLAPNLPCQQAVHSTFEPPAKVMTENSSLKRPVFYTRITDGRKQVHTVLTIEATLMARRLRVLGHDEAAPAVAALDPAEAARYTRSGATADRDNHAFRAWLEGAGLARGKEESELSLAHRAVAYIKHHFSYQWPTPAHVASAVCTAGKSDCGGLSAVFVAVMRSGGVPARLLGGRWALSQEPPDKGQWHVKAEFFARGVGWVPVDSSLTVSDTAGPDFAHLGNDPGDLIAMAAGEDLLLNSFLSSGPSSRSVMQGIVYWWRGSGPDKNSRFEEHWSVETAK